MVSFTCDACGQTVRKNKVEKHWQQECPNCSVLSCLDCGKDFAGDSYASHTSCISEAEKYQGKLYNAPSNNTPKGQRKQDEWLEKLQQAAERTYLRPQMRSLLQQITEYPNVPRKKAKFQNFARNSLRVSRQPLLDELWDIFATVGSGDSSNGAAGAAKSDAGKTVEPKKEDCVKDGDEGSGKKRKEKRKKSDADENDDADADDSVAPSAKKSKKKKSTAEKEKEEEEDEAEALPVSSTSSGEEFRWKSCIVRTVAELTDKYPDGVPVKKLQKKVLAVHAKLERTDRTESDLKATFLKKLHKASGVRVEDEHVHLKSSS